MAVTFQVLLQKFLITKAKLYGPIKEIPGI